MPNHITNVLRLTAYEHLGVSHELVDQVLAAVKSDDSDEVTVGKVSDGQAIVHFETAWSPPLPVLDALAAKFPKLHMRLIWSDEGSDKAIRVYWEDGKRAHDDEDES